MKTTVWARKIGQLEKAGMSLVGISRAVGVSTSTISELKQGRTQQPRGNAALKLIELHERTCNTKSAQ
jgi:IS30 family transposase